MEFKYLEQNQLYGIHTRWALNTTVMLQYLVKANSIKMVWFSTLAYYYLDYLNSKDNNDSKQVNYYKYNMADIIKRCIFLFHVHEAL